MLNHDYSKGEPEFAFDMIYNQKNLPRDWHESLPQEFADAEAEDDKQILMSAAENKIRNTDEAIAEKLIESIAVDLYSEHGDDVQLMQTPLDHPDKKAKIVEITIDFYNKILKLSETDRGVVLRQLFAN